MGFWRAVAKGMLDKKAFEEADRMQQQYGYRRGPSIIGEIFANRRASRWADDYWRDNRTINDANTPISWLFHRGYGKSDLGHPPGCSCTWCGR